MWANAIVKTETPHPHMRVLVVDRNNFYRRLMRSSLHSYGFRHCDDCEDIPQMVFRAMGSRPDIVIMEWQETDFDRAATIKSIRDGLIMGIPADCAIVISSAMRKKSQLAPVLQQSIDGLMMAPFSTKLIGRYLLKAADTLAARRAQKLQSAEQAKIAAPRGFNRR